MFTRSALKKGGKRNSGKQFAVNAKLSIAKRIFVSLVILASFLFGLTSSIFLSLRPTSPSDDNHFILQLYVLMGVLLLSAIVRIIEHFLTRTDHEVILLKQRLAKIYLTAIRHSSLNPEL